MDGRQTQESLAQTVLGLELGSTRIKAVLLNRQHTVLCTGEYSWENQWVDGIWTYDLTEVQRGVQSCFADLNRKVEAQYGQRLERVAAIGISGMMHGYLPLNQNGEPLARFRTWRNTCTGVAAQELTERFSFNIPQRWSIAHLYQAMKNGETHLPQLAHLTTLAGYLHHCLTGEYIVGIGEASGMFPIDSSTLQYRQDLLTQFDSLLAEYGLAWRLAEVLPQVRTAGESAGRLTAEGALWLDPTGSLQAGIPFAPPEGDAGTGMVATNSVAVGTGNVSAGTSDFAMLVTEGELGVHPEVDMVTTPAGLPVAMVHCNNCTSDINAWVSLFGEFATAIGAGQSREQLYTLLFRKALEGEWDGGGLLSYNYLSGEGITEVESGVPLFLREVDSRFTLANFMRTHLMSALATLHIGMEILRQEEQVSVERLYGHGGFFKTPEVGQRLLSAAMEAPVYALETAGEGGPYGMALLAGYMLWRDEGESLADYLQKKVFATAQCTVVQASEEEQAGFRRFVARYRHSFELERRAGELHR